MTNLCVLSSENRVCGVWVCMVCECVWCVSVVYMCLCVCISVCLSVSVLYVCVALKTTVLGETWGTEELVKSNIVFTTFRARALGYLHRQQALSVGVFTYVFEDKLEKKPHQLPVPGFQFWYLKLNQMYRLPFCQFDTSLHYLGGGTSTEKMLLFRLTWRQACVILSWSIIDVGGPSLLWTVSLLGW